MEALCDAGGSRSGLGAGPRICAGDVRRVRQGADPADGSGD
jgi:hypothetical protein